MNVLVPALTPVTTRVAEFNDAKEELEFDHVPDVLPDKLRVVVAPTQIE